MSEPKFKIGDLVVTKCHEAARTTLDDRWEKIAPIIGQIVEVIEQRCYGGMQRLYSIRFATQGTLNHQAATHTEPELLLYLPAPEATGYAAAVKHLQRAKECLVDAQDFELAANSRDIAEQIKKLKTAAEIQAAQRGGRDAE